MDVELGELDNVLRVLSDLHGISPFASMHWCLSFLHTYTAKGGLISVEKLRQIISKIT